MESRVDRQRITRFASGSRLPWLKHKHEEQGISNAGVASIEPTDKVGYLYNAVRMKSIILPDHAPDR